jgi:hypothetical protein
VERFQLKLSKSSVNAIIKEFSLSSGVGRRRMRPRKSSLAANIASVLSPAVKPAAVAEAPASAPVSAPPSEPAPSVAAVPAPVFEYVKKQDSPNEPLELFPAGDEFDYIPHCGCLFLRTADYKAGFTNEITSKLLPLLPDLKREVIFYMLEALIYGQIFSNNNELDKFLGKRADQPSFFRLKERFFALDLFPIKGELVRAGLRLDKINDFKSLCDERLYRLNSLVQELFFPTVYQFLDFSTMFARFFCLLGRMERKNSFLGARLFFPPDSQWANDIVWQEDFVTAVNKINQERIITPDGERIWFDPAIGFEK